MAALEALLKQDHAGLALLGLVLTLAIAGGSLAIVWKIIEMLRGRTSMAQGNGNGNGDTRPSSRSLSLSAEAWLADEIRLLRQSTSESHQQLVSMINKNHVEFSEHKGTVLAKLETILKIIDTRRSLR